MARRSDRTDVVEGSKKCSGCGKVKPLGAFYWLHSRNRPMARCKGCTRVYRAEQERRPEIRAAAAARRADPEVRARDHECKRRYDASPAGRARRAAYLRSPVGRLRNARSTAISKLGTLDDPARIARTEALIAQYDREIARIEAAYNPPETRTG